MGNGDREKEIAPLAHALTSIEERHGRGSVMTLDAAAREVEVIPTGYPALDEALACGGWPRGRVIEVFGPEMSGKTAIALSALASAQHDGLGVALIDMQHAMEPDLFVAFGGDPSRLLVSQPDNGEQAMEIAEALVRSGAVGLVVLDGVEGLVPMALLEGESEHFGLSARLMSQALRKLVAAASRSNTALVFLAQTTGHKSGWGSVHPGGNALKFYATIRVELARDRDEETEGAPAITRVKVVKNKLAPPFKRCTIDPLNPLPRTV